MSLDTLERPRAQRSRPVNVGIHLAVYLDTTDLVVAAVAVFATVDQDLSDRIAKAMGVPTVKPLQVKPASQAVRFQAGCTHGPIAINKAHTVRVQ